MILSKLEKSYSGSSLARIAVEVGEEEDIRLLVQSGSVDWSETAEDEDPAILWALKNEKFGIVDILMAVNKINLQGDPSADLTINCDSETFRVHKYFLCSKSPVFRARLERWEREGEININTMNSNTLSSMIHYIYTGELADGWQDLDIQDVTIAADMYDLPGWIVLCELESWRLIRAGGFYIDDSTNKLVRSDFEAVVQHENMENILVNCEVVELQENVENIVMNTWANEQG